MTSLAIDTEKKTLFAADRNDNKILKFNYDPKHLARMNTTQPDAQPLYLNIQALDSIALFNNSLYWVSQDDTKTMVRANVDGWQNST